MLKSLHKTLPLWRVIECWIPLTCKGSLQNPRAILEEERQKSDILIYPYQVLNKFTVGNKYLLPIIMNLFDCLYGTPSTSQSWIFDHDTIKCKLLKEMNQWLRWPCKFPVMPFGLTNASITFLNLMNQVFYDFLNKFVYLDGIMICRMMKEQQCHLQLVFEKLRLNLRYVKRENFAFAKKHIGHMIKCGQIDMEESNITIIHMIGGCRLP